MARWQEAKRFYGEVLGLRQTHGNDEAGWAAYATGPIPLFLVRKPERAGVAGGAVATLACADLEEVRVRLAEAGAKVVDNFDRPDLVPMLTTYDPDGNMIEIAAATR